MWFRYNNEIKTSYYFTSDKKKLKNKINTDSNRFFINKPPNKLTNQQTNKPTNMEDMMQRMRELERLMEECTIRLVSFTDALNDSEHSAHFVIPTPTGHAVRIPIGTNTEGEWEASLAFPPDCNKYSTIAEIMLFKKPPGESEFDGEYVDEWGYNDVMRFDGTASTENVDAVAAEIVRLKSLVSGVEESSV